MNRNSVIVDGTKTGAGRCSKTAADQNFGPQSARAGRARAQRDHGLEGQQRLGPEPDRRATSSAAPARPATRSGGTAATTAARSAGWGYLGLIPDRDEHVLQRRGKTSRGQYGIFSSNWSGGTWDHTYASNFNDSGLYIGACQQVCDQTINHAWAQYNALGYSGSNSGGWMLVENSQFDNNEDGLRHQQPERGRPLAAERGLPGRRQAAGRGRSVVLGVLHNYVHDNNNPNVPSAGSAAAGPVGTGMTISGGRNDTVLDNRSSTTARGAWRSLVPVPRDAARPCTGGIEGAGRLR